MQITFTAGLSAVAKVIISMEDGHIPANLHFNSPNPDIPALIDGRLQVVTERFPLKGDVVGINSFGFGGSNVHTILKASSKMDVDSHPASRCRRLFIYPGRDGDGLEKVLTSAHKYSENVDMHTLMNETAKMPTTSYPYRGFTILNGTDTTCHVQVGIP